MHKKTNKRSLVKETPYLQDGGSVMGSDWLEQLKMAINGYNSAGSSLAAFGTEGSDKAKSLNTVIGGNVDNMFSRGPDLPSASGLSFSPQTSANPYGSDNAPVDAGTVGVKAKGSSTGGFGIGNVSSLIGGIGGGITNLMGIKNNANLTQDQKDMATADGVVGAVSGVASAFGPWGAAIGTGLNLINSIGGSLIKTPKELKDYKTNANVAASSGYTGVAAQGADVTKNNASYDHAGLAGKLFGGKKQKLLGATQAANSTQSFTQDILNQNSLALDSSYASNDMLSTRLNQKNLNGNMWNNGSIQYGKDGTKVDPIHIKPSHKGKFTEYKKRTGKSTSEALHSSDPHVRKMAQFAANAKKWKHQQGGRIRGTDAVFNYQKMLNAEYGADIAEDGIWGDKTQAAFEQFQPEKAKHIAQLNKANTIKNTPDQIQGLPNGDIYGAYKDYIAKRFDPVLGGGEIPKNNFPTAKPTGQLVFNPVVGGEIPADNLFGLPGAKPQARFTPILGGGHITQSFPTDKSNTVVKETFSPVLGGGEIPNDTTPTKTSAVSSGEAKFDQFRQAALDNLTKMYPGKKVDIDFLKEGIYNKQGGRDISSQDTLKKSGASQTGVSLHNFNAARDYRILIDGKPLDADRDSNVYKKVLWDAADRTGVYHLKDWDVAHIGLAKEGQNTAFDELKARYPDLLSGANATHTINYLKSNPSKYRETLQQINGTLPMIYKRGSSPYTNYDEFKSGKDFLAGKFQQGGIVAKQDATAVNKTIPDPKFLFRPYVKMTHDQRVNLTGNPKSPYSEDEDNNIEANYGEKLDSFSKPYETNPQYITIKDLKYNKRNNEHVNTAMLDNIVKAAVKSNLDPYTVLSIGQRESGLGDNIGMNGQRTNPLAKGAFRPYAGNIMSNWEQQVGSWTKEEAEKYKESVVKTGLVPYNLYNKANDYFNQTNQYPFQGEMKTINDKTKGGTFLRGYNYGDPDYPNKLAKEREILMSPENAPFRKYVASVANVATKNEDGGVIADKTGGKFNVVNPITHDLITKFLDVRAPHTKKKEFGGALSISGSSGTKTATKFNYEDGGEIQDNRFKKLAMTAKTLPVKLWGFRPMPVTTTVPLSPENSAPINPQYLKDGGAINVIVNGALHAHKHDLKDNPEFEDAAITHKGIPVITKSEGGDIEQHAEVERDELILHLDVSKRLEELLADGSDEAAIEAGKLLAKEIVKNTKDSESNIIKNG